MGKAIRALLAVALVAVGGVACGGDDEGAADEFADTTSSTAAAADTTSSTAGGEEALAFEEGDADAVLEYSLIDYEFIGPLEATAGKLFFKAVNDGTEDHELEILDPSGEAVGEIEAMPPGEEGEFAAELAAGEYTFQCILETADGQPHTELGMLADFVVS